MTKFSKLRSLLTRKEMAFLMEAHSGLSAKIVEEAGFEGIWASGLSISAAMGVRDYNEASYTQVLEVVECMADVTNIPILLDGDTGYGNFNHFRRLVKKLCQRDIAGVCLEDKIFPKTNSFIAGPHPLATIEEFCGKIKAGKDSQTDKDFSIVARTEALIAGWPMEEALKRVEKYHEAGADAILIHSKKSTPNEILTFLKEWNNRCPVVIVPTIYYSTPTSVFEDAGVSTIIWGNHNMRASITAMREVCKTIQKERTVKPIEDSIATLKDVFELTGFPELLDAEKKYLEKNKMEAVVLAASRGDGLKEITEDKPKSMLPVRGKPILQHIVQTLTKASVTKVSVVCGYKEEAVTVSGIQKVLNTKFDTTGEAKSLACGIEKVEEGAFLMFGDIFFKKYFLDRLMEKEGDLVLAVDSRWASPDFRSSHSQTDLVSVNKGHESVYTDDEKIYLESASSHLDVDKINGKWMGLMKATPQGIQWIKTALSELSAEGTLDKASFTDVLSKVQKANHTIQVIYVAGDWLDVNEMADLFQAANF